MIWTDATNYLLIFWSSDCGHCLKELPEVYSYLASRPEKDFKVVAIGLETTPEKWNKTIKFWPQFTHVLRKESGTVNFQNCMRSKPLRVIMFWMPLKRLPPSPII